MRPGGSRRKGAAFERKVAKLFVAAGYTAARRGLGQARGAEVCDVEGTPWHIECKRYKEVTGSVISSAIKQAERDCQKMRDTRDILIIHQSDGRNERIWVVQPHFYNDGHKVTPLDYFLGVRKRERHEVTLRTTQEGNE